MWCPTTAPNSPAWRSCAGARTARSSGTTSRPESLSRMLLLRASCMDDPWVARWIVRVGQGNSPILLASAMMTTLGGRRCCKPRIHASPVAARAFGNRIAFRHRHRASAGCSGLLFSRCAPVYLSHRWNGCSGSAQARLRTRGLTETRAYAVADHPSIRSPFIGHGLRTRYMQSSTLICSRSAACGSFQRPRPRAASAAA